MGDRPERDGRIFFFIPNEAHNGYLETYLTLGLIGVFLLIGLFVATFWKIRLELFRNFEWGRYRLGFLAAVVLYNWTEAAFKTLSPVWFVSISLLWTIHELTSRLRNHLSELPKREGQRIRVCRRRTLTRAFSLVRIVPQVLEIDNLELFGSNGSADSITTGVHQAFFMTPLAARDATGSSGRHQPRLPIHHLGRRRIVRFPLCCLGVRAGSSSLVLAALLFALSNSAETTIINAASASLADVTAVINSAGMATP